MSFVELLAAAQQRNQSLVCVGLDPEIEKLPEALRSADGVIQFCRAIIDATKDLVCAYKPNAAFFESLGDEGTRVLWRVRSHIPYHIPVIYDAKRGDIGNTARRYAHSAYEDLAMHAVTLSPYLGKDSVVPFLEKPGKFVFVLAKTSNPGAADFQDLDVAGVPLWRRVIETARGWGSTQQIGFVVGATQPQQLQAARTLAPDALFLIPGVGSQGGKVEDIKPALRADGAGVVVNASRSILYASSGDDYAAAARAETEKLRASLNAIR